MSQLPVTIAKQAVVQKSEKEMEFVPFGAADPIKLSVAIIQKMVAVPTKTGKTCSDTEAVKFMMLCQAQRLNPFAGDVFLTGYDGRDGAPPKFSLITAHVAFLKRAESSPEFQGMESGVIIQDAEGGISEREGDFYLPEETVVGGWAKVYRLNRKPTYRRLAVAQRKPAYETAFWAPPKHAEQIVKCAEADALRSTFPSLLGGLHAPGEIYEVVTTVQEPLRINEGAGSQKRLEASTAIVESVVEPNGLNLPKMIRGLLKQAQMEEETFLSWARVEAGVESKTLEAMVTEGGKFMELCSSNWEKTVAEIRKA